MFLRTLPGRLLLLAAGSFTIGGGLAAVTAHSSWSLPLTVASTLIAIVLTLFSVGLALDRPVVAVVPVIGVPLVVFIAFPALLLVRDHAPAMGWWVAAVGAVPVLLALGLPRTSARRRHVYAARATA